MSPFSDSVTAALVSGTFVVVSAWLTWRIKRADQRVDIASSGLEAQLVGWNNYASSLRSRINDLENHLLENSVRFDALQAKLFATEERADSLERQLAASTREADYLKSLVRQAGVDIANLQIKPKPEGDSPCC